MSRQHDLLFLLISLERPAVKLEELAAACSECAADHSARLFDILRRRRVLADGELELARHEHLSCLEKHDWNMEAALADRGQHANPSRLLRFLSIAALEHAERTVADRYETIELAGQGGLGRVWKSRDRLLDRWVAIKEILPQNRERADIVRRFEREARITARLQHPNIVPVYDVQGTGSDLAYAMRLISGRTLLDAIREFHQSGKGPEEKKIEFRNLLATFRDVCDAVEYAHAQGVSHRDLKPANVALGEFNEVILLDWGLAKQRGDDSAPERMPGDASLTENIDATQPGLVSGTLAYLAPEQARGATDVGSPADVFGLGGILFSILTGAAPHARSAYETPLETLRRIGEGDIRRAREVNSQAPPALDAVCAKAMAPRPEGRHGSARELAMDIERWLAGESVSAYREAWPLRLRRWLLGRPVFTQTAATLLIIGAVGLALLGAVSLTMRFSVRSIKTDDGKRLGAVAGTIIEEQTKLTIKEIGFIARSTSFRRYLAAGAELPTQEARTAAGPLTDDLNAFVDANSLFLRIAYLPADEKQVAVIVERDPADVRRVRQRWSASAAERFDCRDIFAGEAPFHCHFVETTLTRIDESTPRQCHVAHFAVAVRDAENRITGVLAMHYDFFCVSGLTRSPFAMAQSTIHFADSAGLVHVRADIVDGRISTRSETGRLAEMFPDAVPPVMNDPQHRGEAVVRDSQEGGIELVVCEAVAFDPGRPHVRQFFVIHSRLVEMERTFHQMQRLTYIVAAVLLAIAGLGTWFLTRVLIRASTL